MRKPTLWKLRKVLTRISLSMPRRLSQVDTYFSPPVDFLFQESLLYTFIHLRRNVSARISVRRLILVDILCISHNVGFLAGRLISCNLIYNAVFFIYFTNWKEVIQVDVSPWLVWFESSWVKYSNILGKH